MDIIKQAQAKREALHRELARIETFLATAFELQQEFGSARPATIMSDAAKADAPVRRMAPAGSGSATLKAVVDILREKDMPLSTRELLPLVRAKGIEVGGKDAFATLSARISQKGVIAVTGGKWWFIEDNRASDAEASGEEAADTPAKEISAASLFQSNQGERRDAAALAH